MRGISIGRAASHTRGARQRSRLRALEPDAGAIAGSPPVWDKLVQGAKSRQEADPNFFFKLVVEVCVDQIITAFANVTAFGLNPFLWSPTNLAAAMLLHFTAIFNDVVLVYYLAPVAGGVQKTKQQIAHVFQEGEGITMKDRVMCWFDKFKLYGVVGCLTAFFGGILTLSLTGAVIYPARLARTALVGFLHLGISANTRYQTVNGFELLFSRLFSPSVARVGTILVRTCNNFLGARVFLMIAALVGI